MTSGSHRMPADPHIVGGSRKAASTRAPLPMTRCRNPASRPSPHRRQRWSACGHAQQDQPEGPRLADRYLWGHQRATSKARLWFSSIDQTEQAKMAASLWYRQKAQELSRLQGEETFYRRLVGPSDRLEEDL